MDFSNSPLNSGGPERPQPTQVYKEDKSKTKKIAMAVAAALLIALLVGAGVFAMKNSSASSYIDNSKYQAVFLTNGQIYFGKLSLINDQYIRLNDIYYLQLNQSLQQASAGEEGAEGEGNVAGAQSEPQLIKLGQEIHGPDDEMIVNKDQVLFWENLKQEGTLSKTIKDYMENQKKND